MELFSKLAMLAGLRGPHLKHILSDRELQIAERENDSHKKS